MKAESPDDVELQPGRRWFAVHCLPKREGIARQNLDRQNFKTYLPLIGKQVRHARRVKATMAPLFPRYLFVEMNLDRDRWRSVNGTFGVSSLIMERDRPRPLPHGIVESLLSLTNDKGIFEPMDAVAPGDDVRVLNGPFADRLGRVAELKGHERVEILLEIMGAVRPLTLDRKYLLRVA